MSASPDWPAFVRERLEAGRLRHQPRDLLTLFDDQVAVPDDDDVLWQLDGVALFSFSFGFDGGCAAHRPMPVRLWPRRLSRQQITDAVGDHARECGIGGAG